jgi:hypothetical protein
VRSKANTDADALVSGAEHARGTGGGTTGVFGAVYKFTIGPANFASRAHRHLG